MSKLKLTIAFFLLWNMAVSQIYNPSTPTDYGAQWNRIKALKVLHIPESTDELVNTNDLSPQIRVINGVLKMYKNGVWSSIGSATLLSNVETMMNYVGDANYVMVSEQNRGGVFYLVDKEITRITSYIDSGIVFPSKNPAKVWVRDRTQSFGVHTRWFCKGDSTTDDGNALQRCIYAAVALGQNRIFFDEGQYTIGKTIMVPYMISFEGQNVNKVTIYPKEGSVYWDETLNKVSDGYMFWVNMDTLNNNRIFGAGISQNAGTFSNMSFLGTPNWNVSCFYSSTNIKLNNFQLARVKTFYRKADYYIDQIEVRHIHSRSRPDTVSYLIDMHGNGDGLIIEDVASGYYGKSRSSSDTTIAGKGLFIETSTGGKIFGLINGQHYFKDAQDIVVENCHIEGGRMTFDACSGTVRNNMFYVGDSNRNSIDIIHTYPSTDSRFQLNISDNVFLGVMYRRGGWSGNDYPDIMINTNKIRVVLNNNRREATFQGENDYNKRQVMGITVGDYNGIWQEYMNYSHYLSPQGCVIQNKYIVQNIESVNKIKTFGGIIAVNKHVYSGNPPITWNAPTATYYYNIKLFSDYVRLIGKNPSGTEKSVDCVLDENLLPEIAVDFGTMPYEGGFMVRMYRGTSPGSYDKYVDIPIVNMKIFNDNGVALNQFPWKSRTAGGMEVSNNPNLMGAASYKDGILIQGAIYASGLNTLIGTWKQGDKIVFTTPVQTSTGKSLISFDRLTTGSNNVFGTDWRKTYANDDSTADATSNTYTTSLVNTANITASTLTSASYIKTGNIVQVTLSGTITTTAANTTTQISFSAPFTTATTSQTAVGTIVQNMNNTNVFNSGTVSVIGATQTRATFNSGATVGLGAFTIQFQYKLN